LCHFCILLVKEATTMETAVIYCRKSDVSALSTDVSFDDQEDTCRKYAQEHRYSVLKAYRESHSGADLLKRPLIWEAIDDIRSGRASIILVRNWDRLARKPEHQAIILYEIEEKGHGKVIAALEPIDEQDENGKLTRGILALVADAERQHAVARMDRGKKRRVAGGHLPGTSNPLFGYAWLDDEPGKRTAFVIDPETGPIVQRVFHLVTTGHSMRTICRLFNAEGIPTPSLASSDSNHIGRRKVGTLWKYEQVRRIVANRAYVGNDVNIPFLVSLETFEAAERAVRERDSGRPPTDREATWLRGHVWCGVCGTKMVVAHSKQDDKYVYHCRLRRAFATGDNACPGGDFGIRAHLLNQPVYEALVYILMRREQVTELLVKRMGTDQVQALVSMAEGFQVQIVEKQEMLRNARKRSLQTNDDDLAQQFVKEAEELNAEIHTLEKEYADAREMLDDFDIENRWIESTLKRIYDHNPVREIPTPEDVKAFPYEERRLLLAATGLRAEVFPRTRTPRVEVYCSWESTTTMSKMVMARHSSGAPTISASRKPRLSREPPAK
jgi:site-specific DNA recombinase